MHFDQILSHVGDIGALQIRIFSTTRLFSMFAAINTYNIIFLTGVNDHWCALDEYRQAFPNATDSALKQLALPLDKQGKLSQCKIYALSDISKAIEPFEDNITGLIDDKAWLKKARAEFEPFSCKNREFDQTGRFKSSLGMDDDLVCDRSWILSVNRSLYMVGFYLGCFFTGITSDLFGRKKSLLLSWLGMFSMAVLSCFSMNFIYYTICRTIMAICTIGSFAICYVYAAELIGQRWSVTMMAYGSMFWNFGASLLPLLAYLIRDWFYLQLIITIPQFLILFLWFTIPESPRWLFVKDKREDVETLFKRIADSNKKQWNSEMLDEAISQLKKGNETTTEAKPKLHVIVKTPNVRKKTLVLCLTWFTVSMVYYGISLNVDAIPGDLYLNMFLMSLGDYPSSLLCMFLASRTGRKMPLILSMLSCGVLLIFVIFLPNIQGQLDETAHIVLNLSAMFLGKLLSGFAFLYAFIFSVELMPTVIRNSGFLATNTFARIGAALEPFLKLLGATGSLSIFAFFCFATASATFLLPETRGYNLADTIEEAESFGKGRNLLSCHSGPGIKKRINEDETIPLDQDEQNKLA